jgi:hypothetical protein
MEGPFSFVKTHVESIGCKIPMQGIISEGLSRKRLKIQNQRLETETQCGKSFIPERNGLEPHMPAQVPGHRIELSAAIDKIDIVERASVEDPVPDSSSHRKKRESPTVGE